VQNGDRAEPFQRFLFVSFIVPMDEVAAGFEALQPALENFAKLLALVLAVDEECVVILHLSARHVMPVVPEDGSVRLHGSGDAVGNPDDSSAGIECVHELLDGVFATTERHVSVLAAGWKNPAGI